LDTVTYPEAKVIGLINANFVPLKVHIDESPELAKRFEVHWTPSIIVTDPEGIEHHRITGFLPPEEYQAQLDFGIAKAAFNKEDYPKASKEFNLVVSEYPRSDIAPEAQYWLGVSEYKRTKSGDALMGAWKKLLEDYPDSPWAKRVSYIKEQ
jgi:TolA-binding protein